MQTPEAKKHRAFAVDVVRRLRERSFEALWAGGCVRDQLLGHEPKDYDVATSARPDDIRAIFGARHTVAVGEAFGVVKVRAARRTGNFEVEVATFRQDAPYSDGRHPDSVEFSTPRDDAERRDFTVNGIFYDPLEDRVIDFVGGQNDLARGVIRAIGDPRARFAEDKLRLMRAVRFAAAFEFLLDPATRDAIEAMAPDVTVVSAERIALEMNLMLVHRRRVPAMIQLRETGLLAAVLPELSVLDKPDAVTATGRPADEAWVETLEVLTVLQGPTFPLALAALLHGFVDTGGTNMICRRLKLSNRQTQRVRWLVANQNALVDARRSAWPKLQRLLTTEGIDELLALHEAIAIAGGKEPLDVDYCRELLALPPEELDPPLLLTGDDLIEHGVPRGKRYQHLLTAVRDAQLEKKIGTQREALDLVDWLLAEGNEPKPLPE